MDRETSYSIFYFRSIYRIFSELFLDLLVDLDTLLASDEHFLLGPWLEDAKALGVDEKERELYEYNARNQISLWGPTDKNVSVMSLYSMFVTLNC